MTTRRDFTFTLMCSAAGMALAPLAGCATTQRSTTMTAIDCHAHVFLHSLPMPDPRRAPAGYDATPAAYLGLLDAHGMSHGVLVQPSFLGLDNSYLLSVLRAHSRRLRGIAVVAPGVSTHELDALQDAGVVGIRLNLVGLPAPDFSSPGWSALLEQVRLRDWQVEVHQIAQELQPVLAPLLGVNDPGFRYLLSQGQTRRVWVKLSGAYRNGPAGRGEETALAAMPLLLREFGPERLMWGSDWPHTLFEKTASYDAEFKLMESWLPDLAQRQVVLRDTPARLFRF